MAFLTIQAPAGAITLTIEDADGRAVYFLSPVDGAMRVARLGRVEVPGCEPAEPVFLRHCARGRYLCPACDGHPVACAECDADGTVSEEAMTGWMTIHGTILGEAPIDA